MAEFAVWFYHDIPRVILRAGRGYLRQVYFGFSVPLLIRTLFAPWKRDELAVDNLTLSQRFGVLVENIVSRFFGALIRSATLFASGFILAVVTTMLSLAYLTWFVSPLLILGLLGVGLQFLLGGR